MTKAKKWTETMHYKTLLTLAKLRETFAEENWEKIPAEYRAVYKTAINDVITLAPDEVRVHIGL